MSTSIDIAITAEDGAWKETFPLYETLVKSTINTAIKNLRKQIKDLDEYTEISILLSSNNHVKNLNRDYRGKDKPTNVLSFPIENDFSHGCLGDLVFALDIILDEARDQHKSAEDHFAHLIVHGLLHLLGYDHIDEDEAQRMESLEINILGDMGIKNPYE